MISIISILLDLLYNLYINPNSYVLSLFTVVTLAYLKKDRYYYIKLFLLGLLYDYLFTNYFLLNSFIFIIIGFILKLFIKYKNNVLNNLIIGVFVLIIYEFILFILLNIFKIESYTINEFIFIIKHYLIINILCILFISIIKRRH